MPPNPQVWGNRMEIPPDLGDLGGDSRLLSRGHLPRGARGRISITRQVLWCEYDIFVYLVDRYAQIHAFEFYQFPICISSKLPSTALGWLIHFQAHLRGAD